MKMQDHNVNMWQLIILNTPQTVINHIYIRSVNYILLLVQCIIRQKVRDQLLKWSYPDFQKFVKNLRLKSTVLYEIRNQI